MSKKLLSKKKIVVAISGGVDSSVSAALLKEAGFDVVGVFMKLWQPPLRGGARNNAEFNAEQCGNENGGENKRCSLESEKGARLVAEKLKIPFYVFNFENEFRKKVVDYFLDELKAGRTPNPCVVCNKEIKFGLFIEKALAIGADYIATGHYCKIKNQKLKIKIKESLCDDLYPLFNPPPRSLGEVGEEGGGYLKTFKLLKGVDKNKDQSYFLWKFNQNQLSKILFPVGGYLKSEVREIARKFNLPVAEAKESQEICFVDSTIKDFLEKKFKSSPGKIVDTKGNIVGEHNGLWFYTIGQRKGINIIIDRVSVGLAGLPRRSRLKSAFTFTGAGEAKAGLPYYVLDKNVKKNILIVTQNEKDLFRKEMIVKDVNWISGKEPKFPLKIKVKARYRQNFFSAVISKRKNKKEIKIIFAKPQRAITPGQSAVFYKGRELLGGGIIQ